MLRVFEEDHLARAPVTQAVRHQPARETTRVTQLKPLTRKSPRGPADWCQQWGVPRENRGNDTRKGQGGRHYEPEKVPDPNGMKLSSLHAKEHAFLILKMQFV